MPRAAKAKAPIPLSIPQPNPRIKRWIILGLDPSMTRTGFAVLDVSPNGSIIDDNGVEITSSQATWLTAGSVKPEKIADESLHPRNTVWIRGKAMGVYLREVIKSVAPQPKYGDNPYGDFEPAPLKSDVGLIISVEFPTPKQDYLVALNRILNLTFFEDGELAQLFGEIRILMTNASILRSLMGLKKQGADNKGENILKAYEFIDKGKYPQLDSDSCDAVLLAIMARYVASIMFGVTSEVPETFLNKLCNSEREIKGKGRNAHEITKGLLHRIEYWYRYQRGNVTVCVKDASNPKKNLSRANFSI